MFTQGQDSSSPCNIFPFYTTFGLHGFYVHVWPCGSLYERIQSPDIEDLFPNVGWRMCESWGVFVLRLHWIDGDATILELWRLTLGCEDVHQDFAPMPQNKKGVCKEHSRKERYAIDRKVYEGFI